MKNDRGSGLDPSEIVVLISADTEWDIVREHFPNTALQESPFGNWFTANVGAPTQTSGVIFLHGGWGKISAAASAQYAVDCWNPGVLINLGTCGGFAGKIQQNEIILVEKTVVYDIIELMGDQDDHISHYTTEIDLTWLKDSLPHEVHRTVMVSGDRDLLVDEISKLSVDYGAVVGDWESGAIAWVAARNGVRCLILRGVTDIVGEAGSQAYGNFEFFREETRKVMSRLLGTLPDWLAQL